MKLGGNLPPGHNALLFWCGTGSFICRVTLTRLVIPRPLVTQSWTKSKYSGTGQTRTGDLTVHSRTRQPPDHNDLPKSEDEFYPRSSTDELNKGTTCTGILYTVYIYRKDSRTGKIAAGGIWASKSWKNPPAV